MTLLTPSRIANSPELFATTFLKILDKNNNLIPFRWNKAQREFHHSRTGRDIILKARQLGFSTLVQGEMFRRTVTGTRSTITLAHDTETTTKMRLMADRFYNNCKFGSVQPQRKYANATLTTYPEFDSTVSIATAGNLETGRGGTYSDFHGSEVAFWKDAERIVAGAMQGGNPDVVLESTPNGTQGFFYEKCMEALDGNSIWRLHFFPWWGDESYRVPVVSVEEGNIGHEERMLIDRHRLTFEQIEWRRLKIRELGRLFSQEYPEDPVACFLTSGNSYFGDLTGLFTAPLNAEWQEGHEYAAGLDFGQTVDYTAMAVYDKMVRQQVDLLHIRGLEWSEIRKRVKAKYKQWHLKSILAEENSIGSVNIEEFRKDGVNAMAFNTSNESKSAIVSNMNESLHNGGWKMQDIPVQRHEMNTFVASQLPSGAWRYAASGEGHDDTVIANALALWSARTAIGLPDKQPEQKSKWQDGDEPVGRFKKY